MLSDVECFCSSRENHALAAVLQANTSGRTGKWDLEGEAVSSTVQMTAGQLPPATQLNQGCWYAVQTRPKHEKKVVAELQEKTINAYLPLLMQMHRWSDRRKLIHMPLFPGYLFVRAQLDPEVRVSVLRIWGVVGFVGSQQGALPIPDHEIESIQTLLSSKIPLSPYPFLKVGQRVRVRGGALDGLEGILTTNDGRRLVISVGAIHRSLSIAIEGYDVEPA
jgi:transcription antitermination factor NusG